MYYHHQYIFGLSIYLSLYIYIFKKRYAASNIGNVHNNGTCCFIKAIYGCGEEA